MTHEIKVDRETFDYETINEELYLKSKEIARIFNSFFEDSLDEESKTEFLEQCLGIDSEGDRV